ncbi:DNA-J related domain-containing protein [Glaciecola sp. 2405UD65-10]|uniref:DNA-J related domain-containing protein n=1 Tax=Glaciecola sp. 2405UD65-10 TaxID=3397244 RepID=UPI003B5A767C
MSDHERLLAKLMSALQSMKAQLIEGKSEFDIIASLKQNPHNIFNEDALKDPLMLFQTHFVLFHALYTLRQEWRSKQEGELEISALRIQLLPLVATSNNQQKHAIEALDPLSTYYLDWNNLVQTNEQEVESLLNSFWQKMAIDDGRGAYSDTDIQAAKLCLGLQNEVNISQALIKQHYKKRQHQHHPDKGGSVDASQKLQDAYQLLLSITPE